jgi:YcxB-like protein
LEQKCHRSNVDAVISAAYDSWRTCAAEMDVRYSFKIEDFEEIAEVADKLTPRRHAIRFALVCVGVLLLIAPFLAGTDFLHPDRFLLGMCPFAFWLIACVILQNPRRVARKYYAAEVDGTECEASINEDGITTKSSTSQVVLRWTAFSRVIEGQNAIALVEKTIMFVFPKRAFSQEQWDKFLSLLRQHVPVWSLCHS